MSAPDLDATTTGSLRALLAGGSLSVLLGAGASMTVGLPDWETLAVNLLCRSNVIDDPSVARAFLRGQDPMLAVEAARAAVGDDAWPALLHSALYAEHTEVFPSALHRAVARLAAERTPGSTRLFTLNFDTLLEEAVAAALQEEGRKERPYTRASATPRGDADSVEVHHLHGAIARDADAPATDVILGLSDFVGLSTKSWQFGELQQALQRGPLILVGTSYRDPDMREWIFNLTRDHPGARVMALLSRAGMGLSRTQFTHVKGALQQQWRSVGIEPILLHDHSDSAQAIRELSYEEASDYRPPQVRASSLWARLCQDFERAQRLHSDALEGDRRRLAAALGADANLTLWIANGAGELVRWAGPDRLYKDPAHLKRIPANFDSPWIAGECLAVDDVVAREPVDDPDSTRRWRSVVASPITVAVPGGPPFATAVLSSATPSLLRDHDLDSWFEVLAGLANDWSARLEVTDAIKSQV
ncbi:SIR2 family protein [Nocardioides sp. Bht2]|uniref:SIR2 family protein n=1 Tax=Nocardioides sp. Bht2 TaxID=3392297 RepID=UPI0039B4070D